MRGLTLMLMCVVSLASGCAGDPAVQRWAADWLSKERAGLQGDPQAITDLERLAKIAPTRADADAARFANRPGDRRRAGGHPRPRRAARGRARRRLPVSNFE